MTESIPWTWLLPALVAVAFVVGVILRKAQDKSVEAYRQWTTPPGEVHVDDLAAYARRMKKRTPA